ncbi:MAG: hypothetical protein ACR2H1_06065, partial [Limisphaerales bacterium]
GYFARAQEESIRINGRNIFKTKNFLRKKEIENLIKSKLADYRQLSIQALGASFHFERVQNSAVPLV